ncbi:uncharacterized protein LOC113585672 [Electrophorus electricus]|uniref:uncharacterized protein LOC113585672 n=1 Tax=Electrophorus electricus TaxID=8005 RepID=UPI0015D0C910|nr:uncharacterized protein LOC113585672 [Electrophorus electricus]
MATNGLKGSPSTPENLPPKKRNPRESQCSASAEPVFKTPSPFWKQNGLKAPRRPREPVPISLLGLHSADSYHPLWPEVTSDPNPVLTRTLGNVAFPTWGQNLVSCEHRAMWSDPDKSDPVTRSFCWGASHWNCLGTETRDASVTSLQSLHGQYGPPVVKPVPQSLASHYTRGVLNRDATREGETRLHFEEESGSTAQWQEKLYIQQALHDWRARKDYSVNRGPLPHAEPGTEFLRHKYYSEFRDSPQEKVVKTEDLQHQELSGAYPSFPSTERSETRSDAHTRDELPLMAVSENAESRRQLEPAASSTLLSCFAEGSLIELAGGKLKRVEDLKMEDFEYCTELCPELSLRRFTVQKIIGSHTPGLICLEVELEDGFSSKMSLEVCEEYPLFACARGWASCQPERTARLCSLRCHQLRPGDLCLALTPTPTPAAPPAAPPAQAETGDEQENGTKRPVERATLRTARKRHSSAPALRNVF